MPSTETPSTPAAPTTSSTSAPDPSPERATSRLLLWLPVPAVVAMAHFAIQGDQALNAGLADPDPLLGLGPVVIGALATVVGIGPLVFALLYSFAPAPARRAVSLGTSVWTAVVGLGLVAFLAYGSATDYRLGSSSTAGAQHPWHAAAAVVVLVPLAVVVAVRAHDRLTGRVTRRPEDPYPVG